MRRTGSWRIWPIRAQYVTYMIRTSKGHWQTRQNSFSHTHTHTHTHTHRHTHSIKTVISKCIADLWVFTLLFSSTAGSKHWSQQLYWWWQREDKTLQHHLTSTQSSYWHIQVSIQTEGGWSYCPLSDRLTGWLAEACKRRDARRAAWEKPATGCAFFWRTRKSWERSETRAIRQRGRAELRRSDTSRRRGSCLSGRCRGRRP